MILMLCQEKQITEQEAGIMRAAVSAQALAVPMPEPMKDAMRARILRSMLTSVVRSNRGTV